MTKVFVTGATGTIGRQVVAALQQHAGVAVTAASRQAIAGAPTATAIFDFKDPSTYSAVDGHAAVFVVGPPLEPGLSEMVAPFLDYLADHGRPRVTYLSALGMNDLAELPFHAEMEAKLRTSGLPVTILRPSFFASNFGIYERENIEQRGIIFTPSGAGEAAFVAPADIGEVAALALATEDHVGRVYELTGPEVHSMHDIAALISELTGKTIVYPEPSDETYRGALAAAGAPPFVADYMIPVYNLMRSGAANKVTQDIPTLLGRPATDVRSVLAQDFA
ncbi:NAD(P)H-binding protein [Neolewinella lacunae]|uniref:NmrA family NAD(P)-binding protein n=1 Tax=Neolewinella lacunae TaxID=1517758 RepID=A0A923PMN7_9BACT|nr:NmrA family NAD(P)-binding protein [Neolewinella lacunae]MBC6994099.1 NmrA family NAD(P)-binding protein [Neolewinella lacunae]MDN3636752.1 NAD(P)H-binding protein [Neolewinella lacunae]